VLAATAVSQNAADPLSGLVLSELAQPRPKPGWAVVKVVSSSLNMHDLWTLRGVGHPAEQLPIQDEILTKCLGGLQAMAGDDVPERFWHFTG